MERNQRRSEGVEIDLTPMIDVVFNLIIFFMLTLVMNPYVQVILPKAFHCEEQKEVEIKVYLKPAVIDERGEVMKPVRMYVNEEPVTRKEMRAKLAELYRTTGKHKLVIKADKDVFYKSVLNVMEIARSIGIENFALATEKETR
jgi:biopolymer transport protein ExbD